ncbi:MAG: low molecular weight phosphotyrosine protein phosphatase [Firmicutes bacterium]|nr:low molecular weight phosphotyrosine protein phosphatase [Bacillota bacterium]
MIKICFVCLGNICRSPMAEFIMKDIVKKNNLESKIFIESRATSYEETGNGIYPPAKKKLAEENIYYDNNKVSTRLEKEDLKKYDYIIGMEERNIINIERILKTSDKKIKRLLDYSNNPRDIADPWYTGNFDKTYDDILEGCKFFIDFLIKNNIV